MVLVVTGSSMAVVGAQVGAQVDVQAFCQSRSDLAESVTQEDDSATEEAVDSLAAGAPAEVLEPTATLAALVAKRGHEALATKKGRKAIDTIDSHVVANCGFPVLDVSAIDYQFEGISGPLTAGAYVVEFTNNAPAEHHELVLSQVDAGVNFPLKKLLALSSEGSASRVVRVGAAFAEPGDTETLVVFLEPGRYIYACFIDVGTTSGGDEHGADEHGAAAEPHWKEGMRGQVEVVGGA